MSTDSHDQERQWAIERRRCLVRELLRLTNRRGIEWLKGYVRGWKLWEHIRDDLWRQYRAGNTGEPGDWR
jgi:hypothetical protein